MKMNNKSIPDNFKKSMVTNKYTFYTDFEESDENGNTLMYDSKNNKLISDNYFAYVGLMEELEKVYLKKLNPIFIHDSFSNYLEEFFGK